MARAVAIFAGAVFVFLVALAGPGAGKAGATLVPSSTSSSIHDGTHSVVTAVAAGSTVHDLVSVDGGVGNPTPTGNVTVDWFGNNTCTGAPVATSAPTALSGGSVEATGFPQGPLAAGSYAFLAHYAGDATYAASDGPCESLQVVDSYITIVPAESSDQVGDTHTYTAQVFTNDGSGAGYLPANGVSVTFALLPGSVGSFTSAAPFSCVTSGVGSCTIATSSSTVGDDTAQAAATVTVGGVALTRTTGTAAPGQSNGPNAIEHWIPPPSPAISITKSPKTQVLDLGGTASFTITVANTGNDPLTGVTVSDPLAPACSATGATNASLNSMTPGSSVTYTCTLAGVTASFTNTATASGTGSTGQIVSATDSAPVAVVLPVPSPPISHPSIRIVKDPKNQALAFGGTATFRITVTNNGDVILGDVMVTDPLSPACGRNLGTLGAGASKSYPCARKNVVQTFENVATATGNPPTGAPVQATDSAPVEVAALLPPQHPKIAIVVNPNQQALDTVISQLQSGKIEITHQTARFRIKVTNVGDTPLYGVAVGDPHAPSCNRRIGTLAAGASRSFDCARAEVSKGFTNVAVATGRSPKRVSVRESDHASVVVKLKTTSTSEPKFTGGPPDTIDMSPKVQQLASAGTATFTITVKNYGGPGTGPHGTLTGVTVHDPLSPDCARALGALAINQSKSYTCTRTSVESGYTNVAGVSSAQSGKGLDAVASGKVVVGVTIKMATPTTLRAVTRGTKPEFYITITALEPLTNVSVSDPLAPGCDMLPKQKLADGRVVDHSIGTMYKGQIFYIRGCLGKPLWSPVVNVATVSATSGDGVSVAEATLAVYLKNAAQQ